MKRQSKGNVISTPQKSLDYFFAKARAKKELPEDDEDVVLVKTVHRPKAPLDRDPDWAINNGVKSNSTHTRSTRRSHERKAAASHKHGAAVAENPGSSRQHGVEKRTAVKCALAKRSSLTDGKPRLKSQEEREFEEIMRLNNPPSYDKLNNPPSYDKVNNPSSHDKLNNPLPYDKVNDPPSYDELNDPPSYDKQAEHVATPHSAAPVPSLSLRILDSQEYYDDVLQDENTADHGEDESLPLEMEVDVLATGRQGVTSPHSDLEETGSESRSMMGSQALSLDLALLGPSAKLSKSSPVTDQGSDKDDDVLVLSSSDSPQSDEDVFNTSTAKPKHTEEKGANSSHFTKLANKERGQATKSLNTVTGAADSAAAPSSKPPVIDSSGAGVTSIDKPTRSKTWGPKSARKARKLKTAENIERSSRKETNNTTSSSCGATAETKLFSNSATKDSSTRRTTVGIGGEGKRPITPDDMLEDLMMSLDESNTYSPTKRAKGAAHEVPSYSVTDLTDVGYLNAMVDENPSHKHGNTAKMRLFTDDTAGESSSNTRVKSAQVSATTGGTDQGERSITPDDALEDLMLSLNESNTYSPTKQSLSQEAAPRVPYYLANVTLALNDVLYDSPIDIRYFDADDIGAVTTFTSLDVESQKMYVRLLFRKHGWISRNHIKYDEIYDMSECLERLMTVGFVQDNSAEMPLVELLNMLPAPRLKKVCKDMKIDVSRRRPQLIQYMVEHTGQQTVSSMLNAATSTETAMIKRARRELPTCYKLMEQPRDVFMRILMLYALVFDMPSGNKEQTRSQLIYTMLKEAVGQIKYPQVPQNRQTPIFMDREHVLRRRQGQDLEDAIDGCLQKKEFQAGLPHVEETKRLFHSWMNEAELVRHDESLPSYLRRYTCTSQIIRCLANGAELLQKLRLWQDAANIYHMLLRQQIYSLSSRGHWYDRLSLIYDHHIKDKAKAVGAMVEALSDGNVRGGYKLSIYQRLERVRASKQFAFLTASLGSVTHHDVISAPKIEISGMGGTGEIPDSDRVNVFLNADSRGRVTTCSVESVALDHYMTTYKLERGLHRESAVFTTLYGLLFWDIIFQPGIPDTFYNSYQYQPLDFQTALFYERRKAALDSRLAAIRSSTPQALLALIEPIWQEHHEECCVCVQWDVFLSAQDALDLMLCLGSALLAHICERFVKDYRFCRSGMPDLTMWSADTGTYKIVEVKGPNDKLSTKQILWLDYLLRRGADAEVCHVKVETRGLGKKFNT